MSDSKCHQGFDGPVKNESDSEDSSNSEEGSASESDPVQGEFDENIDSEESESVEENETSHLSLEAKVKRLQDSFKSIPPLMIKKILQQDDVTGDLDAAKRCLKAMSSSEGLYGLGLLGGTGEASGINKVKKQKPPVLPKKNKKEFGGKCIIQGNESTGIEKATVQVSTSESLGNELLFEDIEIDNQESYSTRDGKVKILQERFKGFPPFVIRKVLGRPDVKEDLQTASECLKDMSHLKGTFKERPKEDAFKEHNNPDRRKAWEEKENGNQEQGFAKQDTGKTGQDGKGSAEINTGKNTQKKKKTKEDKGKRIRRRNRKKETNEPKKMQKDLNQLTSFLLEAGRETTMGLNTCGSIISNHHGRTGNTYSSPLDVGDGTMVVLPEDVEDTIEVIVKEVFQEEVVEAIKEDTAGITTIMMLVMDLLIGLVILHQAIALSLDPIVRRTFKLLAISNETTTVNVNHAVTKEEIDVVVVAITGLAVERRKQHKDHERQKAKVAHCRKKWTPSSNQM